MRIAGFSASALVFVFLGIGAATDVSVASTSDNVQVVSQRTHPQPGSPVDVLDNYQTYETLAAQEPTLWGGAYVDGDSLVIKYVGQTSAEATTKLQDAGVVRGIRLVSSTITMADLQQAQTAADTALQSDTSVVSWGPDYANSGLVVSTTTANAATLDALRTVVSQKVPVRVFQSDIRPSLTSRYYDTIPYYGGNLTSIFRRPALDRGRGGAGPTVADCGIGV